MNIRILISFISLFLVSQSENRLIAQIKNLGQPIVINHDRNEYNGGSQSWDLQYSTKEYIFVANNNGLLVYNGIDWTNYKTKNKTIVRSLVLSENEDKIYVGAQGEFGYFQMEEMCFVYKDLTTLIPAKYRGISDVWEIENIQDTIYFRADNKIFRYFEDKIDVYLPNGTITFIKEVNHKLLFNQQDKGLNQLDGITASLFQDGQIFTRKDIVDAVQLDGTTFLIVTRESGVYFFDGMSFSPWKNNANDYLKKNFINSSHLIESKNLVCFSTHAGGLAIFDLEGKIQYLINSDNGLQNNTVTSITTDSNSNIWIGTYNGIDEILLTSNNDRFYPDNGLKGAIFDIELWQDQLYFATSNGLYTIASKAYYNPLDKSNFDLIPGTEGECWGLDLIDDELFVAHNSGGYIFDSKTTLQKLDIPPGVWKYVSLDKDRIIIGSYQGLIVIVKQNNQWKKAYEIQEFEESSRILVLDKKGILWVTHPYKGIYKLLSDDGFQTSQIDTIQVSDGVASLNNCYGHELDGRFLVSNETKVYAYDYNDDKFVPDGNLDSLFQSTRLIRLIRASDDYYYISNVNAGKLKVTLQGSETSYSKIPLLANYETFVGGFENLKVLSKDQLMVCTEKGVLISNTKEQEGELKVRIKKVLIGQDNTVVFDAYQPESNKISIPFNNNQIEIHYSSVFANGVKGDLQYSYRLLGARDVWSEWTEETSKSFDFLPPNEYTFEVRSLSKGQQVSHVDRVNFTIKPHILLSIPFKIAYFIIGVGSLLLLSRMSRKKLKKEKKNADKKVKVLEAENYDIQLKAKNKELAYSTMHLLQKSEFITNLKDDIYEVKRHLKDPSAKKELKKIISKLADDQRVEEDWERFSIHFDKVHHDFFKRLKAQFPDLSSKDLKISAYLRLNLTTKEIAPLLGISVRGVEISRYRLRKKIDLDSDINLNEFMITY